MSVARFIADQRTLYRVPHRLTCVLLGVSLAWFYKWAKRAEGHEFETVDQAQAVVLDWCYGFYNHNRRHSSAGMMSPINYENTAAPDREAA